MAAPDLEPVFVSVIEAARMLGLGRTKTFELIATGELESVQIDRRRLVPVDGIRNYGERVRKGQRVPISA